MMLKFPNGNIDIVVATGYIKKENNQLKHYFMTETSLIINCEDIEIPEILGYADKKICVELIVLLIWLNLRKNPKNNFYI